MSDFTISILDNKIFFQILKEIKLFSKFNIKHYEDLDLCAKDTKKKNQIIVFFNDSFQKIKAINFPLILITQSLKPINLSSDIVYEQLKIPFKIIDFEKKITSLIAKNEFRKNSLINLKGYIIDKNERKMKKNNVELQLSEKEVNFLISFKMNQGPIGRNFFLKNVWKYSEVTETHTVETHIHRLRKKILDKFNDNNFIKNNKDGYYI